MQQSPFQSLLVIHRISQRLFIILFILSVVIEFYDPFQFQNLFYSNNDLKLKKKSETYSNGMSWNVKLLFKLLPK